MQYYSLIMAFSHQIQNAKHLKNKDDKILINSILLVMILFTLKIGGMTNILYIQYSF